MILYFVTKIIKCEMRNAKCEMRNLFPYRHITPTTYVGVDCSVKDGYPSSII